MISWQIFWQSVLRVFNNLGAAIKVSLIPYVIAVVAVGLLIGSAFMAMMQSAGDPAALQNMFANSGLLWLQFLIAVVVMVVCLTWTAVAWHRYVLLDETPGWLPPFNGGRIGAYVLRTLLIFLIMIPVAIIILLVLGLVGGLIAGVVANANATAGGVVAFLVMIVSLVLISVVGYRLTASMPGAAIDNGAGIGDTWRATAGSWGAIIMLGIITTVISYGISFVLSLITVAVPIAGIILQVLYGWLAAMVGVSILTTLYGYYVERRSIS